MFKKLIKLCVNAVKGLFRETSVQAESALPVYDALSKARRFTLAPIVGRTFDKVDLPKKFEPPVKRVEREEINVSWEQFKANNRLVDRYLDSTVTANPNPQDKHKKLRLVS